MFPAGACCFPALHCTARLKIKPLTTNGEPPSQGRGVTSSMGRPGVDRAGGGGAWNVLGAGSIGGAPLQEAGARPDPAAVAVADRDAPAS